VVGAALWLGHAVNMQPRALHYQGRIGRARALQKLQFRRFWFQSLAKTKA